MQIEAKLISSDLTHENFKKDNQLNQNFTMNTNI